jgi:hypothetical protein
VSREVDKDVVVLGDRVRIRRAVLSATLEVLAVRQTRVDIIVAERNGAQAFKIEIKRVTVDLRGAAGQSAAQAPRN